MWYNIIISGEKKEDPYFLKGDIFYRHQTGEKIPIINIDEYSLCKTGRGALLNKLIKLYNE